MYFCIFKKEVTLLEISARKMEFLMGLIPKFLMIVIGFLIASAFGGLTLLKAYDEFKKGKETKNRLRIWSSFFMVVFLYLMATFGIVRGSL